MEDARGLLGEVEGLRGRARADQQMSSVPLFVFGVLVVAFGFVAEGGPGGSTGYWLVAGPLGLALVAWWHRRHARQVGAGPGRGPYVTTAVALLVLFLVVLPLLFLAPMPAVALMLLIVAGRQGNGYLAGWAVVLGVVGGLENLSFFNNRLYDLAQSLGWFASQDGWFPGASVIVYGLLGAAMIGAGWRARRAELA